MKKIISLLVLLVICLVGCGKSEATTQVEIKIDTSDIYASVDETKDDIVEAPSLGERVEVITEVPVEDDAIDTEIEESDGSLLYIDDYVHFGTFVTQQYDTIEDTIKDYPEAAGYFEEMMEEVLTETVADATIFDVNCDFIANKNATTFKVSLAINNSHKRTHRLDKSTVHEFLDIMEYSGELQYLGMTVYNAFYWVDNFSCTLQFVDMNGKLLDERTWYGSNIVTGESYGIGSGTLDGIIDDMGGFDNVTADDIYEVWHNHFKESGCKTIQEIFKKDKEFKETIENSITDALMYEMTSMLGYAPNLYFELDAVDNHLTGTLHFLDLYDIPDGSFPNASAEDGYELYNSIFDVKNFSYTLKYVDRDNKVMFNETMP